MKISSLMMLSLLVLSSNTFSSDIIPGTFVTGPTVVRHTGCPSCYTEKERVKNITLDFKQFSNRDELQKNSNLGRLYITKANGDPDGDGDFDELYMLGSRSFSIWTLDGQLVFDSGDDFEQITAAAIPLYFNTNEDENTLNARSDDRGPAPGQFVVGKVGSRQYMFASFERIGGIIVYDITYPYVPRFEQYINNRNFTVDPQPCKKSTPPPDDCRNMGDLQPKGLLFISKEESPLGVPMLAVSHEASDTTTLYRINRINYDYRRLYHQPVLPHKGYRHLSGIYERDDGSAGADSD